MAKTKNVQFDEREYTLSTNTQHPARLKPILKSSAAVGGAPAPEPDYNEELEALRQLISRCFVLCNAEIEVPAELEYESVVMLFAQLARVIPQNFKERVQAIHSRLASQQQDLVLRQEAAAESLRSENHRLRQLLGHYLNNTGSSSSSSSSFEKALQSLVRDSVNRRETEMRLEDLQAQYDELKEKYARLSESTTARQSTARRRTESPPPSPTATPRGNGGGNNTQQLENRCLALIQERAQYQQEVNRLRRELREARLLLRMDK